jgi:hypothetical protein
MRLVLPALALLLAACGVSPTTTPAPPAALAGPDLPAWGRHIFAAWIDLHAGRGGNGMGPNPIAWADLAAWAALTGTEPSPFEVRTIMAIDRAWLEEQARTVTRTPPPAPPPSRNPGSRTRP